MDDSNLFCFEHDCHSAVTVFALKGRAKVASCDQHASSLILKGVPICSIAGYASVNSSDEMIQYQEMEMMTNSGLRNIAAMEKKCETELADAVATLEAMQRAVIALVDRCFRESRLKIEQKHEEIQRQLTEVRSRVAGFLTNHERSLSVWEEILCQNLPYTPNPLRLVVSDVSFSLAEALTSIVQFKSESIETAVRSIEASCRRENVESLVSFAKSEAVTGNRYLAAEAISYAKSIGCTDDCADILSAIRINRLEEDLKMVDLFPLTADLPAIRELAFAFLTEGSVEKQNFSYENCARHIRYAWSLLRKYHPGDAKILEIGLLLGEILCLHVSDLSESEAVFKQCEAIAAGSTEDVMRVNAWLAHVYFFTARYTDTETVCVSALRNTTVSHTHWIAVYFLSWAYWKQGKDVAAETMVEEELKSESNEATETVKMLKSSLEAEVRTRDRDFEPAEKLRLSIKSNASGEFSTSIFFAHNLSLLGQLYTSLSREEAEPTYHESRLLLSRHYPRSVLTADILSLLGDVCRRRGKWEDAKMHYLKALQIYQVKYGSYIETANACSMLAVVFMHFADVAEAEKYYDLAQRIYTENYPKSIKTANNLTYLAAFYASTDRTEEAIKAYLESQSIYAAYYPVSLEAAYSLHLLGELYNSLGRLEEAGRKYLESRSIYSTQPPTLNSAINLNSLAKLYRCTGKREEAVEMFEAAKALFDSYFPDTFQAARNLGDLGDLLVEMKEVESAGKMYEEADAVLAELFPEEVETPENLVKLGNVLVILDCLEEAEACYKRAQDFFSAYHSHTTKPGKNLERLGNLYVKMGRWEEAEYSYMLAQKKFTALDPFSIEIAEVLDKIGDLYDSMGETEAALGKYMEAEKLYLAYQDTVDRNATNSHKVGSLYIRMEQWDKAEQHYLHVRKLHLERNTVTMSAADNVFHLGHLYDDRHRFDEAITMYEEAYRIYSSQIPLPVHSALTLSKLASVFARLHRFEDALSRYSSAHQLFVSQFPESLEAAGNLSEWGNVCESIGRGQDALEKYLAAEALYEGKRTASESAAHVYMRLAEKFQETKQWQDAETRYLKAHQIYSTDGGKQLTTAEILNRLGHVYISMGRSGEDESAFLRAEHIYASADPDSMASANNLQDLGNLYLMVGRSEDARQKYSEAESVYSVTDPESLEAAINLSNLGVLSSLSNCHEDAITEYLEAREMFDMQQKPTVEAAVNVANLAVSSEAAGKDENALEAFETAQEMFQKITPLPVEAGVNLMNWGQVYVKMCKLAEGQAKYLEAEALFSATHPRSMHAANNLSLLGTLYSSLSKFKEAHEKFAGAKRIYAEVAPEAMAAASNFYGLGKCYASMHLHEKAKKEFLQAKSTYQHYPQKSNISSQFILSIDWWESRKPRSVFAVFFTRAFHPVLNLIDLGNLYQEMGRWKDAEAQYLEVERIYAQISTEAIAIADNHSHLGDVYLSLKQLREAENRYIEAQKIYSTIKPVTIHTATILTKLGDLDVKMNRRSEAEKKYAKAEQIYASKFANTIEAAINLSSLGVFYRKKSLWEDSRIKHEKARQIFQENDQGESNEAAYNLYSLALANEGLRKIKVAIEYLRTALTVWTNNHSRMAETHAKPVLYRFDIMFGQAVLRSLSCPFTELIYSTQSVQVYAGVYSSVPVVYKVLQLPSSIQYQDLQKECEHMMKIENEHIVKLMNFQWSQIGDGTYLVIVLERCEKDLSKDIKDRKANNFPYPEEELWKMMIDLIQTLATMQEQGLAHRDIKPDNIFLSQKCVKIGDFGSSRFSQQDQMVATVVGTPLYLSPKLRSGFSGNSRTAVHNIFKSDVYSLGLTFIAMAQLNPPTFVLTSDESQIKQIVSTIKYSWWVTQLITWMLAFDEESRPDFIQLNQWILQMYSSQQPANQTTTSIPAAIPPSREISGTTEVQLIPDRRVYAATPNSQRQRGQPSDPRMPNPSKTAPYPQPQPAVLPTEPRKPADRRMFTGPPSIQQPTSHQERQVIATDVKDVNRFSRSRAEERKDDSVRCLDCEKLIDRSDSEPVQLKCDPSAHMYCSIACFQASIRAQKKRDSHVFCPVCNNPIEDDDQAFYACPDDPNSFRSWLITLWAFAYLLIVCCCCCCRRRNDSRKLQ